MADWKRVPWLDCDCERRIERHQDRRCHPRVPARRLRDESRVDANACGLYRTEREAAVRRRVDRFSAIPARSALSYRSRAGETASATRRIRPSARARSRSGRPRSSSQKAKRSRSGLPLSSVAFLAIPYPLTQVPDGMRRAPAVVEAHVQAKQRLQAEIARRLAIARRKEIVLFVHGYHVSFEDAALTMGELCHFLGRDFVCGIFTWPAGSDRGILFGYDVDRESAEYAVEDLVKLIRIIAGTPGLEKDSLRRPQPRHRHAGIGARRLVCGGLCPEELARA